VEENSPNGRRISPSVKRVAGSEVDKAPIKRRIFRECFTALITPLRDGKVDEKAFQARLASERGHLRLGRLQQDGRVTDLSHREHMRVTELCVEVAARRVPVIAGTGSNSHMRRSISPDTRRKPALTGPSRGSDGSDERLSQG
jgi:hypothetical protein